MILTLICALVIIYLLVSVEAASRIAQQKGFDALSWRVAGFIFGILALVPLLILPKARVPVAVEAAIQTAA